MRQRIGYCVLQAMARMACVLLFRIRPLNLGNFPSQGRALICSNHQSHLDPVLVGLGCRRRLNYLARKSLFKFKPFAWLINFLDAIPIDLSGSGLGGLKETIKRLKRDEMVVIFPEGTRTPDGELGQLSPGFLIMARRTKSPLVPVGLDGAHRAWPRNRKYPLPAKIAVSIGKPIPFEDYRDLDDEALLAMLRQRIEVEFLSARRHVG